MRRYRDDYCDQLLAIIPIGEQTQCQHDQPAVGSSFTSSNFICIFQSELPVLMNSLMFSYRRYSDSCDAQVDAFESASTGECLSTPEFDYSYKPFCTVNGTEYVIKRYGTNETCELSPGYYATDDYLTY